MPVRPGPCPCYVASTLVTGCLAALSKSYFVKSYATFISKPGWPFWVTLGMLPFTYGVLMICIHGGHLCTCWAVLAHPRSLSEG